MMRVLSIPPSYHLTLLLQFTNVVHGSFSYEKRTTNITSDTDAPTGPFSTSSFNNVSTSEYQNARALVDQALKDWAVYNKARFERPARNKYTLRPENPTESQVQDANPHITKEITDAAALIAEINVAKTMANVSRPTSQAANKFWMEGVDHLGTQPYGGDSSYKVGLIYFHIILKT
jgi:hypothetical protein